MKKAKLLFVIWMLVAFVMNQGIYTVRASTTDLAAQGQQDTPSQDPPKNLNEDHDPANSPAEPTDPNADTDIPGGNTGAESWRDSQQLENPARWLDGNPPARHVVYTGQPYKVIGYPIISREVLINGTLAAETEGDLPPELCIYRYDLVGGTEEGCTEVGFYPVQIQTPPESGIAYDALNIAKICIYPKPFGSDVQATGVQSVLKGDTEAAKTAFTVTDSVIEQELRRDTDYSVTSVESFDDHIDVVITGGRTEDDCETGTGNYCGTLTVSVPTYEPTPEPEPVQPSTPTEPTQPETPTQPTAPTQPEVPTQPTTPTQPETPVQPTEPTIPTEPETPAQPSEPVVTQPSEPAPSQPSEGGSSSGGGNTNVGSGKATFVAGQKLNLRSLLGLAKGMKYSSSSKGVASVNGSGVVTGKKAGTATITIYEMVKEGKKKVKHEVGTYTVTIEKPTLKKLTVYNMNKVNMNTQLSGTSQKPTWTSTKPAVASIDENGNLTFYKAGSTTIKANFPSGSGLSAKTIKAKVTVKLPKISKKKVTVKEGKSVTIKLNNTKSNVSWKADGNVSLQAGGNQCVITGVSVGTTVVTASVDGMSFDCYVTVKANPQKKK